MNRIASEKGKPGAMAPTLPPVNSPRDKAGNNSQQDDMINRIQTSACMISECPICRTLLENYAANFVADKAHISPFDRLVAQDFIPAADLGGGTRFCRFHSLYKKRYEILCYVTRGLKQNIRYEALYDHLSLLDGVESKSVEWLLGDIKEEIQRKQVITRSEVKDSLLKEAKRLTELWDAQVEDLEAQIAQSFGNLQRRQAQDLAVAFENLENRYEAKRPHFSSNLLELFQAEPRMCQQRAFSQALKVVDAGKKLEALQTLRFQREIEREKSLKLSWKICQQTRQSNGVVDKMMRFRRREESNREVDRERLKARIKTALNRLEKIQRQSLVLIRAPFLQHIYRVRHCVETEAKNQEEGKTKKRKPIYESRKSSTFRTRDKDDLGRSVRAIKQCPPCSSEHFFTVCMKGTKVVDTDATDMLTSENQDASGAGNELKPGSPVLSEPGVKPSNNTPMGYSSEAAMQRPRSVPAGSTRTGLPKQMTCEWCGCNINVAIELELEKDMPASVQRALDSTEFASIAMACPSVDDMISGPKSIPDVPRLNAKGQQPAGDVSFNDLKKLLVQGDADSNKRRIVSRCCSFKCMYAWNNKYSPAYLRSRRHLQIDLMQRQKKETDQAASQG